MIVAVLRFSAIVLASLTLGLSFSHVMEMPIKLSYPPDFYAAVNNSLYRGFGVWGALLEPAKLALCGLLCFLLRHERKIFAWTVLGTTCFVAALATWLAVISPVNQANLAAFVSGGEDASVRAWSENRFRWEWGHFAVFVFQLLGVGALVASLLVGQRLPTASARVAHHS